MWQAQFIGTEFVRPDSIPTFSPPPIRVPPYRQDGGSFNFTPSQMSPRPHDSGGSPRGPVQFGRYTGGDAGISSSMPSFLAGTSSGFTDFAGGSGGFTAGGSGQAGDQSGGGYEGSGSGGTPEQATSWVDDLFGPPGAPYGYHGQQQ
uniref:keratin, type I cytoskeletal 9-like n=1 Tax=Erigeron canadensis TaxID=72917 RepID=UPI001CB8BDF3|nr:keratin, type I cytoskeletal 9-like [Erigeron canadensis]